MSTHRTCSFYPVFFLTLNFTFSQTFSYHMLWKDSSTGKESACNAEDLGLIPGSERSPGEVIGYPLQYSWALLVAQIGKESACNVGHLGLIPALRRFPGGGHSNPPQYSCLENLYGQEEPGRLQSIRLQRVLI